MRQLILKVPQGYKEGVNKAIEEHQGKNTIQLDNQEHDVFIIFLPNNKTDNFLDQHEHVGK